MIAKHLKLLFCMISLFLVGAGIFFIGFLPVSITRPTGSYAHNNTAPPLFLDDLRLDPFSPKYGQVIFMLIDALRNDFPNVQYMPFVYNNTCTNITLRVDIPTVTMPRLKSLTSGTLSNFIDVVLNLGQAEKLDDSFLHRLHSHGRIINFAGDRTWTNLFPSEFTRKQPNMDSFFVNDFNEGDEIVTRFVESELERNDWNLLILHYLGLDHIGHVEGTASAKIPTKLAEMDEVVHKIYNSKRLHNQLLLITGDHGMRTGGGHGGSTLEEIYVPLLIFKEKCSLKRRPLRLEQYSQIDIAPTLSILFSTEIPRTSIGCLIPELLQDLSEEEQLYSYYYNAYHLMQKILTKFDQANVRQSKYYSWFQDAKSSHRRFLRGKRSAKASVFSFENAKRNYMEASREISSSLSQSLVGFNYILITIGLSLTICVTIFTTIHSFFDCYYNFAISAQYILLTLWFALCLNFGCHYTEIIQTDSLLLSAALTIPIAAIVLIAIEILKTMLILTISMRRRIKIWMPLPLPLLGCFVFHILSLASSSFIEEEHQTWYYLGKTVLIFNFSRLLYQNVCQKHKQHVSILCTLADELWNMRASFFILISVASLQKLNQTGDKWRHLEDFGDILVKTENKIWLSLFLCLSIMLTLLQFQKFNTPLQKIFCYIAVILLYCFRGAHGTVFFIPVTNFSTTLILGSYAICLLLILSLGYKSLIFKINHYGYEPKATLLGFMQTNLTFMILLAMLLHKPHNVGLPAAMILIQEASYKIIDSMFTNKRLSKLMNTNMPLVQKTLLTMFIAKMFYFYQGNSNSLATIDLNPGYIGQSSYNPIIVAIFVTLNTYCAEIIAFQFLVLHIFDTQSLWLPMRQEKEQQSNMDLVRNTESDLQHVLSLYTVLTMVPVTVYLCVLVVLRFHLFIYTVFAPKMLYECYSIFVFYLNFTATYIFLFLHKG